MHYRVADHGLIFSTRDRGERLRTELLAACADQPDEEVTIDFDKVLSATHSFLDELICKTAEHRHLMVINVSPKIAGRLERTLRRRGLDPRHFLASSLTAA